MRSNIAASLLTLTIALTLSSPARAAAGPRSQKADPQLVAKLAQILERSGYPYKKAADNIWVVNFKGKSQADINIFVTSADNLIVMGAVVAPKSAMKVTPELMLKLLRLTHEIDRVKIGFDDDEDLFLRAEVISRCFDVEDFKSNMEQVSAGTDKVRAEIKSYLTK